MKKKLFLLFTGLTLATASIQADIVDDIKESDAAIVNPETMKESGTWYDRGALFMDAYLENTDGFLPGMNATTIKLTKKNPAKIEKDAKDPNVEYWFYGKAKLTIKQGVLQLVEDIDPIDPLALNKAYEAFKKSIAIYATEEHGFFSSNNEKKSIDKYKKLSEYFVTEAYKAYQNNDFAKASDQFEKSYLITSDEKYKTQHEIQTGVDTSLIFNIGFTANNAKNYKKAAEYFAKAKDYNYGGADLFRLLGGVHMQMGDTTQAIAVYKEGFNKYITNEALLVEMINIFVQLDKADEAIKYLDEGIKVNPNNASFYNAKGVFLNTIGKENEAVEAYKKSLEIKPDYFESYFNIGVIVYNQAVELQKEANLVPANDTKKYDELLAKSNNKFLEAMPFFEGALKVKPEDKDVAESLKNIYFRNRNKDPKIKAKYEALVKKLKG